MSGPAELGVLHLLAPARVGGLERVVQALAEGHARGGHRVHVACILAADETVPPFVAALADAGVGVHASRLAVRAYGRERALVRALCRRIAPSVVHTHGYRVDVVDGAVARSLRIPAATTVHGFTRGGWKNRLYEALQRRAYRRFDAVVAVSRTQVDALARAGVPSERIHLIPNAWAGRTDWCGRAAARAQLGIAPGAFHIGWVGRLGREKGADVLLAALARLRELPFVVSVIGDGRERAALEARAASLGVAGRVRWHGLVQDAARLFPAFDVFALSSRTEGTPIVLFEAMAARVPIVATRVGGVPDVVASAEALLVPSDAPGSLADAIRSVYTDPAAAAARASAARKRLTERFGYAPWLARYEALYRWLLEGRERERERGR